MLSCNIKKYTFLRCLLLCELLVAEYWKLCIHNIRVGFKPTALFLINAMSLFGTIFAVQFIKQMGAFSVAGSLQKLKTIQKCALVLLRCKGLTAAAEVLNALREPSQKNVRGCACVSYVM